MKTVFVTRPLPGNGISLLKKQRGLKVIVHDREAPMKRKDLLKAVRGCDAVLTQLTERVDTEFLKAAGPQLRIVANYAVGYDNFDMPAIRNAGVLASNTPGVLTDAVAEHTLALMLAITKRICEADQFARMGRYTGWEPSLLLGTELKGKILGIVGLGRIGSGVAERCKAMGMNIAYHDVKPSPDFEKAMGAVFMDKASLLKHADVISIHVPLLPTTRHLFGAKEFRQMKKSAYLVNTSRGPIIDEAALAVALKRGDVRGAAIDVFEFEPKITAALKKLPNVILTPHIASATMEARSAMSELAARNILAALNGKPMPSQII